MKENNKAEKTKRAEYGSDAVIDVMKALDIEYVALNPGATFRGLHDSIVTYGGNKKPEIILCPHEGIAIDIAHGYNLVSPKPMAAMVHNVVGLLQGSMAIFNAWVDRAPVLIIGATGPIDTEKRRPWIDWIHTALDQGNAVRDYTKWDNTATSVSGAVNGILRGYKISNTEPKGPVYVCVDSGVQEQKLDKPEVIPDIKRYAASTPVQADMAALRKAAELLISANHPVIIADYLTSKAGAMEALVALAETLSVPVINHDGRISFPTSHPLNLTKAKEKILAEADVVLSLDVFDLYHALNMVDDTTSAMKEPLKTTVIDISLRHFAIKSWAQDYGEIQPVDLDIAADTRVAIPALTIICREMLNALEGKRKLVRERFDIIKKQHDDLQALAWENATENIRDEKVISRTGLAVTLWNAIKEEDWVLINNARFTQPMQLWDISRPYQYIGGRTGGGLGFGIGRAIGVTLAHKPFNRLCINMQPDGDLLYTTGGLWTVAHQQIPMLTIMFNNRTYRNSERHQEIVAKNRGRSTLQKGIGTEIKDPVVDFAALAKSFGIYGLGPVERSEDLRPTIDKAIKFIKEKKLPVLIDVVVSE